MAGAKGCGRSEVDACSLIRLSLFELNISKRFDILLLLFCSLTFFYLLYSIWDSDFGYMYRKHFASSSHLTLDFKDLDSNTTVADIHKQYPINWLCREDNSMPEFGDSYCFDELQSWNELSAFTVVFWFKNGKLSAGKIDYPLWLHKKVVSE